MAHMKDPEKSKGKVWQDKGDGSSRVDIRHGYIFFGLDLTQDARDIICFNMVQKGIPRCAAGHCERVRLGRV